MAIETRTEPLVELESRMQELMRLRDELWLQAHLAGAEFRDQWLAMEPRRREIELRLQRLRETAGEVGEDVGQAARLLIDEVSAGYRRIARVI